MGAVDMLISCTPTNHQTALQRFPNVPSGSRPEIKNWRCDLTALSRVYNLYFVACNAQIYVYQPSFPNQCLPESPALILSPPTTPSILHNGIDDEDQHSITRLHMDYLGVEEVVLAVCDDGDVIGYRVTEIHNALPSHPDFTEHQVKVFLHRNVGASAWGLAVHREARLIAISANNYEVTVLAYALVDSDRDFIDPAYYLDESSSDWEKYSGPPQNNDDFPFPRRRNHMIKLSGSRNNVPSVSFDNSGKDPKGRWLFSSSIDGKVYLWDIHNPNLPAQIISVGCCPDLYNLKKSSLKEPDHLTCRAYQHGAWAAMFINPQTTHRSHDFREAFGNHYKCNRKNSYIWDITKFKELDSEGNCYVSFYKQAYEQVWLGRVTSPNNSDPEMLIVETDDEDESASNVSEMQVTQSENENDPISSGSKMSTKETGNEEQQAQGYWPSGENQNVIQQYSGPSIIGEEEVFQYESEQSMNEEEEEVFQSEGEQSISEEDIYQYESEQYENELSSQTGSYSQSSYDSADEGTLDYILPQLARTRTWRYDKRYCQIQSANNYNPQHFNPTPYLIVTKEEIFLLQRPFPIPFPTSNPSSKKVDEPNPIPSHPPLLMMRQPLLPIHHVRRHPSREDRHCFVTQIPELSAFIVATSVGRAGIFSITQVLAPGPQLGATDRGDPRPQHQHDQQPIYGFRLEHLLPFKRNSEKMIDELVPVYQPLVGVAAGPVQGELDGDDDAGVAEAGKRPRRWRVIMLFKDHSSFAYVIERHKSRGRERDGKREEEAELGVEELAV